MNKVLQWGFLVCPPLVCLFLAFFAGGAFEYCAYYAPAVVTEEHTSIIALMLGIFAVSKCCSVCAAWLYYLREQRKRC